MTAFNEVSARILKFLSGLRPGSVREPGRSYDFLLQQINRRRAQLLEIDGTQLQAIIHELRCQAWNDSLLVEVLRSPLIRPNGYWACAYSTSSFSAPW